MHNEFTAICRQIGEATGIAFKAVSVRPLSGGDINSAYCLQGESKAYFIKLNRANFADMFAAEFAGLDELASTNTVRVPQPILTGTNGGQSFLVLEYVEIGTASKTSERLLGQQLAQLHQQPQPFFGWHRDNTIGSSHQANTKNENWPVFWREQRLAAQLNLAAQNGYKGNLQRTGEQLCVGLDAFFTDHKPKPSLLHGDLWGGNAAVDRQGNPVIFDPACYYGDLETDLAMTELFGGFSQDFYAAYQELQPLAQGYRIRKNLYNLYHVLNHLNLFGGGYLRQAENMTSGLLAEIK